MNPVRMGVIGMGYIGQRHAQLFVSSKVPGAVLTAVCRDKSGSFAVGGVKNFDQSADLIRSGLVDAVVVATPHPSHSQIASDALENGLHVMVEKPIATNVGDARRLLDVHGRHEDRVFGVMLQMRVQPRHIRVKQLLAAGALGEIIRYNWIATDWFRTQAYFSSGPVARHMEGRGRRRPPQPKCASVGPSPVVFWYAQTGERICPIRTVSQYRSRRRGQRSFGACPGYDRSFYYQYLRNPRNQSP